MIRILISDERNRYLPALLACAVSIALHAGTWLAWQTAPVKAKPVETPPQVIEVALTAPAAATPKPETPPEQPKKEDPAPKKPEKPKPQAKPKLPPKPAPKLIKKPAPLPVPTAAATDTAVDSVPEPISTAQTNLVSKPTRPSAPTAEPLVKAVYSSPSLKNPPTHYPRIAQMRQWEGTVILEIRVLANGSAGDIKIIGSSGHEVLDDSAVEQVKTWRFIPAHKGDKTVDDWVRVPITFKFKHY